MVDPEKYLKLADLINSEGDFETLEAFMYNNGKIVLDKRHLYQNYPTECIDKIKEVYNKPNRKVNILKLGS
jgi:hypothetical protein